jgi:hypothetical protein
MIFHGLIPRIEAVNGHDAVGILENLRASRVVRVQKNILDERFLLVGGASPRHENIQALL